MAQRLRGTVWIARCFGIRVGIDPSWLLVFALVTWALSGSFADLGRVHAWALAALAAAAFFASVVIHEFAHALTARRFGVTTLAIRLFLFGGAATIASEPPTPAAEVAIAAAGPMCSALLAVLCGAGVEALLLFGGRPDVALLLMYLAAANALVAAFNLLPAYPLDGGRILRACLWQWRGDHGAATRISSVSGMALAFALGAAGIAVASHGRHWDALWYVAVAGFVSAATIHSYRRARRG
ncbi:MAG: site-2 protease family protein [bacterium]|nr:site-2 protease family protein [bacterium]